jgi:PHD/YefM family antitoxin component YafN of YafNO toxin-antitoxin module
MKVYTFSEARQKLASVLNQAKEEGEVRIRRKDGSSFIVKPASYEESPLQTDGVSSSLSAEEIVEYVREGRERGGKSRV